MRNVPFNRLDRKDTPNLQKQDNPLYPVTYDYSYNNDTYPQGAGITPTQITSILTDKEGNVFERTDEYSLSPQDDLATYAYNVIADHCEDLGIDPDKVLPALKEFNFDASKVSGYKHI